MTLGRGPDECNKRTGERFERESGFAITVASEIMAVLELATDLADLRRRLGKMIAAFSRAGEPLTADDFGITGALSVLLMDALMPTTMQARARRGHRRRRRRERWWGCGVGGS